MTERELKMKEQELNAREKELLEFAREIQEREKKLEERINALEKEKEHAGSIDHLFDQINNSEHKLVGVPVEVYRPRETLTFLAIATREGY